MSTAVTAPSWSLGERLKKARKEAGITPSQMAERLNVSERMVRNYERAVHTLQLDVIRTYEEATGVSILWLIRGEAEIQSQGETPGSIAVTQRYLRQEVLAA